jgi:hypothetical protein
VSAIKATAAVVEMDMIALFVELSLCLVLGESILHASFHLMYF